MQGTGEAPETELAKYRLKIINFWRTHFVGNGGNGKEEGGAHRHSQGECADGERGLVDDLVFPGVGQELVVALVIAAPNAEEGVGTEGEKPEEQNQDLKGYEDT